VNVRERPLDPIIPNGSLALLAEALLDEELHTRLVELVRRAPLRQTS
jgi:hypothetical protein